MLNRGSKEIRDAALLKLNQEKKTLEEHRLRLVQEIERIDNNLNEIQAEFRKVINAASPLLNLPTEVTCIIYESCVESYDYEEPKTEDRPLLPEVVMSHLCKQTRDVSLNNPRLWTKFFFRADNVEYIRNSIKRFNTYIERSGSRGLELFFDFMGSRRALRPQLIKQQPEQALLFDMALQKVQRWKTVTLLHIPNELRMEARLESASAPNLEYFVYSPASLSNVVPRVVVYRTEWVDISNPTIFKGGAPKLRYLQPEFSTLTLPPLSNVTTLRLEGIHKHRGLGLLVFTWNSLLHILSIPSLANLSLFGISFLLPEVHSVRTISMNNLRHLRYSRQAFMTLLLPFIRAPLLETLSISFDDGVLQEANLRPNLFGIPEDSYFFPSLQTLIFVDSTASFNNSAWHFMHMTRNVTSILVSHFAPPDTFFDGLKRYADSYVGCWPKLTTLTANFEASIHSLTRTIGEFALSRPKNALQLRLFNNTNYDWKAKFPHSYEEIQEHCIIEVLGRLEEGKTALIRPFWPPGVDCPDYAFKGDPFIVRS